MSAAVICPYFAIILFMIYFVDDPMHPVKKLCRGIMYVLSTASSNIVFSSVSMF